MSKSRKQTLIFTLISILVACTIVMFTASKQNVKADSSSDVTNISINDISVIGTTYESVEDDETTGNVLGSGLHFNETLRIVDIPFSIAEFRTLTVGSPIESYTENTITPFATFIIGGSGWANHEYNCVWFSFKTDSSNGNIGEMGFSLRKTASVVPGVLYEYPSNDEYYEQRVVRIFVDYENGKMYVTTGLSLDTEERMNGYCYVVDYDFKNSGFFNGEVGYINLEFDNGIHGGGTTQPLDLYVQNICNEYNYGATTTLDGELSGITGKALTIPNATITYKGVEETATATVFAADGNEIATDAVIEQAGTYTVRYSITKENRRYYKDYTVVVEENQEDNEDNEEDNQPKEVEVNDRNLFVGTEAVYGSHELTTEAFTAMGEGYLAKIYGAYAEFCIDFNWEDFKNLTFDESKGTGHWTNDTQVPFITFSAVCEGPTGGWAVAFKNMEAEYHVASAWSIGDGGVWRLVERLGENVHAEDLQEVTQTTDTVNGTTEQSIVRIFIDYERGAMYITNGEDATYNGIKKSIIKFDVDFKNAQYPADYFRFITFNQTNTETPLMVFVKDMMGKPLNNSSITLYGQMKDKYVKGAALNVPTAEIYKDGEYYEANAKLILSDGTEVTDLEGYTFSEEGEYTIRLYTEIGVDTYYKDYSISVAVQTVITVVAPTVSVTSVDKADGLPSLIGTTTGGVYRWKANQTLTVGTNSYEWEFIPLVQDETVVYENAKGTIEITVTDASTVEKPNNNKNGGCKGSIGGGTVAALALSFVGFFLGSKKRK